MVCDQKSEKKWEATHRISVYDQWAIIAVFSDMASCVMYTFSGRSCSIICDQKVKIRLFVSAKWEEAHPVTH